MGEALRLRCRPESPRLAVSVDASSEVSSPSSEEPVAAATSPSQWSPWPCGLPCRPSDPPLAPRPALPAASALAGFFLEPPLAALRRHALAFLAAAATGGGLCAAMQLSTASRAAREEVRGLTRWAAPGPPGPASMAGVVGSEGARITVAIASCTARRRTSRARSSCCRFELGSTLRPGFPLASSGCCGAGPSDGSEAGDRGGASLAPPSAPPAVVDGGGCCAASRSGGHLLLGGAAASS